LTPPDIISWRGKSQMNYIDFTLESIVERRAEYALLISFWESRSRAEVKKQMADSEKKNT
jgi:hypothetical protein